MEQISAEAVLAEILDAGSWQSWDTALPTPGDEVYAGQLARAAQRCGTDESIVTGSGSINGIPVAVVAGEFGFLAGSVGAAVAARLVGGVRRATDERLPLIGLPTSGGTRMQEGTPAFLQMVPIAAAIAEHRAAGLPYLVWLRDPTLGGVMATWGSLGQVTAAAVDEATIGFLGARVFDAMHPGETFPAHVQSAGHLRQRGVIDDVVPLADLRGWLENLLAAIGSDGAAEPAESAAHAPLASPPAALPDAWECVTATRVPHRPGAREVIAAAAEDVVVLSGTGAGERSAGVLLAVGRIGGRGCVIVAQDRSASEPLGPAALRTARRGYQLAAEWGLPVVTLVDTEGAEVSAAAEQGAMAGEIARNLAELSTLPVPVVAALIGSGCGGGALAMLPADTLIAATDSWITPLPPEGASAIIHRTTEQAPAMARSQHITAVELAQSGVIDVLVPGPGAPSERQSEDFVASVAQALTWAVATARRTPHRVARFAGAPELLQSTT